MENVVYFGSNEYIYIPQMVTNELSDKFDFSNAGVYTDINKCINVAYTSSCHHLIIDITQFDNNSNEIVTSLNNYRTTQANSNIIVLAIGYFSDSDIIQNLMNIGINCFVLSSTLATQKEELTKGLKREISIQPIRKEPIDIRAVTDKGKEKRIANNIKVGVVGALSRIGTTTQCIQGIKYLSSIGYSACYIQINQSKFVETLSTVYDETIHDEEIGMVKYANIDMYYKPEKIKEIYKNNYDFYIFDYGTHESFNTASFYDKDIHVAICGTMPQEMLLSTTMIDDLKSLDMKYIFSFCHESLHKEIVELMEEKGEITFFAGYCPDPFYFDTVSNIWDKIIIINKTYEKPPQKEKKGIMKLFRGKQ